MSGRGVRKAYTLFTFVYVRKACAILLELLYLISGLKTGVMSQGQEEAVYEGGTSRFRLLVVILIALFGLGYGIVALMYMLAPKQPGGAEAGASCGYLLSFAEEQCDEAGCQVAVKATVDRDVVALVGNEVWRLRPGENVKRVSVKWNSTLYVVSKCFNATYEPKLYVKTSVRLLEYDFDTGRRRAEVSVELSLPYTGAVQIGRQAAYPYRGRATATVETYGNAVEVRIGKFSTKAEVPAASLDFNATAWFDCNNYVYRISYKLHGAEAAYWRGNWLKGAGELAVTARDKLDKLCIGDVCKHVEWVEPRAEAELAGLYYVYYFPVAVVRVKNPGPACWSGVVKFDSPTKLYEARYPYVVYNTPFGAAAFEFESDMLQAVLRQAGAELRVVGFELRLRPGEAYTFAVVPLSSTIYVGERALVVPKPPAIAVEAGKCSVRQMGEAAELKSRYVYATTNFTAVRGWVLAEQECAAVLRVDPGNYTVVDPLVAANTLYLAVFYRPRVSVSTPAAIPLTIYFPVEVATNNATAFAKMGYKCVVISNSTYAQYPWLYALRPKYACKYEGRADVVPVPFAVYLK